MLKSNILIILNCFLIYTILIYPQEIDYISMLDMEIGTSTNDIKNKWKNSELTDYGYLKMENYNLRANFNHLLYRDMNEEFTFTCNYLILEDSLMSIRLTNSLNLNDAAKYVNKINDKYGFQIEEGNWQLETLTDTIINRDGSINIVSFGVEPRKDKVKFSFANNNERMSYRHISSLGSLSTKNDTLDGVLDLMWKSSKETVIERMKSYTGVKLDTIYDYRVDFVGGLFSGVKVKRWVFAFDEDRFYNLLIEFDSKESSNDFSDLEKYLIEGFGSEYNYRIVYEDKNEEYMKDLTWLFYNGKDNTIKNNPRKIIANIYFRGCCNEANPKPVYISFNYIPISKYALPK